MSNQIIKENGLKMSVIREGSGPTPKLGQSVMVHYEIHFGEGTSSSNFDYETGEYIDDLCDSTYDERNPYSGPMRFVLGQETPKDDICKEGDSIKGFDEALLEMKVGEKRNIFIPSELAYGIEGASSFHSFFGYRIPPNRPLAGIIELVEIIE